VALALKQQFGLLDGFLVRHAMKRNRRHDPISLDEKAPHLLAIPEDNLRQRMTAQGCDKSSQPPSAVEP
jgi:hypothetical protein